MSVTNRIINDLKELKKSNLDEFHQKYDELDKKLFSKYCFKKKYKDECDPFCAGAFTQTCQYLKEMNRLSNELDGI